MKECKINSFPTIVVSFPWVRNLADLKVSLLRLILVVCCLNKSRELECGKVS